MEERFRQVLLQQGYVMLELLGKGGYAVCYKVRSLKWNAIFACKIVLMNNEQKNGSIESVHDEINVLVHLYHANLIHLYDNFIVDGYGYLIIDYCPNGSIKKFKKKGSQVTLALLSLFYQVLQGLHYLHQNGYAHHDIKSANILLDEDRRPKLADFGMCKHYNEGKFCHSYKGSKQFACPEIHQHLPYDPFKGDIWSLGICFFEVIFHKLPWPKNKELLQASIIEGGPIIPPKIPFNLSKLLMRMTAMNPASRPTALQCMEFIDNERSQAHIPNLIQRRLKFAICIPTDVKRENNVLGSSKRYKI